MGFRFRKSISICPGVRLNIGKNGLSSVSVGARGASLSFGRQGTHANIGLPGTGLSYRTKLSPSTNARSSSSKGVSNPSNSELIAFLQAMENEIDDIVNIHFSSPSPVCTTPLEILKAKYVERKYRPFEQIEPSRPSKPIVPAKPEMLTSWLPSFLQTEKSKQEREHQYQLEIERWGKQNQIEQENYVQRRTAWATEYATWQKNKACHEQNMRSSKKTLEQDFIRDSLFFEEILANELSSTVWPRETNVSFQVDSSRSLIELDVDLPEVEDIPMTEYRLNKKGTEILQKSKSDKKIRMEYARFVHGILFKLVAIGFSSLPFNTLKVSGFTQRIDGKTGKIKDDYIISAEVSRMNFESLNFSGLSMIDPVLAFNNFKLSRKMTATGIFKAIEPI